MFIDLIEVYFGVGSEHIVIVDNKLIELINDDVTTEEAIRSRPNSFIREAMSLAYPVQDMGEAVGVQIIDGESYISDGDILIKLEEASVVEGDEVDEDTFAVGDRVAVEPNIACGKCSLCEIGHKNFCRAWSALARVLRT